MVSRPARSFALPQYPTVNHDRRNGFREGDLVTCSRTAWVCASANAGAAQWLQVGGGGSAVLGGDVSGLASANTVEALQGRDVYDTAPSNGQVLTWDAGNTRWAPATPSGGGASWQELTASKATSDATTGITTGLSWSVNAGTSYVWRGILGHSSGGGTHGLRLSMQATGGAAGSFLLRQQSHTSATGIGSSAVSGLGTWTQMGTAATSELPMMVDAFLDCTVSGTVTLWMRSETGGTTVTLHRGGISLHTVA